MKIDISDIILNTNREATYQVALDTQVIENGGVEYSISKKKPFDLRLNNKDDQKILISGSTEVEVLMPCDRCLKDVRITFPIMIERSLELRDGHVITDPDEEEDLFFEDHHLDVNRLIYDEILVDWPAKVLCKEDCKGLCSVCGHDLNKGDCGCNRTVLDPRMAKFQDVFNEFKEV